MIENMKERSKKTGITKTDKGLAAGIFLGALCLWAGLFFLRSPGTRAEITIDGTVYGVYALDEPQTIDTGIGNILEIKDGRIRMIDADCPDRLCVYEAAASRTGETIVCLPHKLSVRILGGDRSASGDVEVRSTKQSVKHLLTVIFQNREYRR